MKTCSHCGKLCSAGAIICTKCGMPFEKEEPKEKINESTTIGILSIVFGIVWPIVGLILGIVGYVKSNSSNKNKKLSLIGLILSIIFIILIAIITILAN
jgi:heme/copper-type cytochrome/quinol oxidase subunit 2